MKDFFRNLWWFLFWSVFVSYKKIPPRLDEIADLVKEIGVEDQTRFSAKDLISRFHTLVDKMVEGTIDPINQMREISVISTELSNLLDKMKTEIAIWEEEKENFQLRIDEMLNSLDSAEKHVELANLPKEASLKVKNKLEDARGMVGTILYYFFVKEPVDWARIRVHSAFVRSSLKEVDSILSNSSTSISTSV